MFGLIGPLGVPELIIILVVVLIIFGPGKLPQIGKAMGDALRNFRSTTKDTDEKNPEEEKKD